MKVIRLAENGALIQGEMRQPSPGAGEVLVRVHAAGVTPTELEWYPTSHKKDGQPRTGAVPSHEFSGEIAELGKGVGDFAPGQEVYGMNDWYADGALAEFCVTEPRSIAPKPRTLSHAEAATVPISALTARQGLFNHAKLKRGERVLVHGGAGGVGIFAIQLARAYGAEVITTVSAHNIEFVKSLGASQAIDYKAVPFEKEIRDIDVVFDTVGGETLRRSRGVLKQGGRLVTIVEAGEEFFIVEPNREQLVEVARRIDAGELRTVADKVVRLAEAPDAYAGKLPTTGRGKMVVAVVGQ